MPGIVMPARCPLLSTRFSPRLVALLMAMGMVVVGFGLPPVPVDGVVVGAEEQPTDSFPCEETSPELAEDEEVSSGKHAAVSVATLTVDQPANLGLRVVESVPRLQPGFLCGASLIRGPPVVL